MNPRSIICVIPVIPIVKKSRKKYLDAVNVRQHIVLLRETKATANNINFGAIYRITKNVADDRKSTAVWNNLRIFASVLLSQRH